MQIYKKILAHILGEYTQFDDIYKRKMISIHGIPLAKIFLQEISNEQNHFSYDLIAINEISQKTEINRKLFLNPHVSAEKTLQTNQVYHPHTFILLDQLTPVTLGSIMKI